MEHSEWLHATTNGDSAREIGRRTGISFRTITSQITRNNISAENVIEIAAEYGRHPVRALVDCGYLGASYATTTDPATALRMVSEEDLADEVLRRMKLDGEHEAFTTPVSDLNARRPTPDVHPEPYAAKRRKPEPSEGDDDFGPGA